jgi:hypothetical protein
MDREIPLEDQGKWVMTGIPEFARISSWGMVRLPCWSRLACRLSPSYDKLIQVVISRL